MPTLNVALTMTYGSSGAETAVPCREPINFAITYTEETTRRARIPAGATDYPVLLDTVGNPKFIFVESLETTVTVKLSDGVATDPAPIQVLEEVGWIMIANPNGQAVNRLLVTTPASPTTGALIRVISFE